LAAPKCGPYNGLVLNPNNLRRFARALVLGNLVVLAILLAAMALALQASYQAYAARARQASENMARMLSISVASEIKQVDNALLSTNQQLNRLQALGKLDLALSTRIADEQKAQVPQVGTVRVTDAGGVVLNSGQTTAVSVNDRDYFQRARAQPERLAISEPLQGRITTGWGIVLARARLGPDGSFRGVAYANLRTTHFTEIFDDFQLGPQGAVTLRTNALQLIARYSPLDQTPDRGMGSNSVSAELKAALATNPDEGAFTARTALDGVERISAYQHVPGYPLLMLVGLAAEDYLAPWRLEALQLGALTLLLAAVVVSMSLVIYRRQQVLMQTQHEIARLAAERGAMLDNNLVGMVKLKDRVSVWHNQALADIFGYGPGELLGQNSRILYLDDASHERIGQAYGQLRGASRYHTQLQMVRKDGRRIWIDLSGAPLPNGESLWLMVDITAVKDSEIAAKHQAMHDALTGLANRMQLMEGLAYVLRNSARHGHKAAVCYIDLDGFKTVNDQLGHDAGDALLREVARRMTACVRGNDLVARLGGDEFAVVLSELHNTTELQIALNRLLEALQNPVALQLGQQHHLAQVGASIGSALYPDHGTDVETLLTLADQAMYTAKRGGKNRFEIHNPAAASNAPLTTVGAAA
jgi:diguanylate cyclase (GGDEF)-like protein/PAS domain S-box-containing protein